MKKWGIDGSIAYAPIKQFTAYLFGSWNQAEIQDNIQIGNLVPDCDTADPTSVNAIRSCAFTAGNRESGTPKYSYGGSFVGTLGPVDLGITAKRTGERYIFDNNAAMYTGPIASPTKVYDKTADAYWLVNLDARMNLGHFSNGLSKTYLQLNVYNLFDTFYVGGFGGGLSQSLSGTNYGSPPFVQVGAPRTISATLDFGF